tara:strand:- start:144 stop:896 length:753 start_codon:yes stop_codon:yes gene_type:complete
MNKIFIIISFLFFGELSDTRKVVYCLWSDGIEYSGHSIQVDFENLEYVIENKTSYKFDFWSRGSMSQIDDNTYVINSRLSDGVFETKTTKEECYIGDWIEVNLTLKGDSSAISVFWSGARVKSIRSDGSLVQFKNPKYVSGDLLMGQFLDYISFENKMCYLPKGNNRIIIDSDDSNISSDTIMFSENVCKVFVEVYIPNRKALDYFPVVDDTIEFFDQNKRLVLKKEGDSDLEYRISPAPRHLNKPQDAD